MTAQDLWKEGRLEEAIESQIAEVKSHPTDAERRYLLFALLCFTGDLDRASRQLDALGVQDEKLQAGTLIYHNLLASEAERRRVHAGDGEPLVPDAEDAGLAARIAALKALGQGDGKAAAGHVARAREAEVAPVVRADDDEFTGIEDTDELLGANLEIFAGGRYLLLPFPKIRTLTIPEPKQLLDLMWAPAELEDVDGNDASVHVPVFYAGSHEAGSSPIRLGRGTEWNEDGELVRGLGQRVLAFGGNGDPENDRAVLSIRRLEVVAEAAPDGS